MIVVTGSNGFIGSNLIKGLNEIGHKNIIAVDDQDDPELIENIAHCDVQDFLNIDGINNLNRNKFHFVIKNNFHTNFTCIIKCN